MSWKKEIESFGAEHFFIYILIMIATIGGFISNKITYSDGFIIIILFLIWVEIVMWRKK